jgi:hypothetical protein
MSVSELKLLYHVAKNHSKGILDRIQRRILKEKRLPAIFVNSSDLETILHPKSKSICELNIKNISNFKITIQGEVKTLVDLSLEESNDNKNPLYFDFNPYKLELNEKEEKTQQIEIECIKEGPNEKLLLVLNLKYHCAEKKDPINYIVFCELFSQNSKIEVKKKNKKTKKYFIFIFKFFFC